jgi:hypothetical protein
MVFSAVVVAQPPAPAPDGPINTLRVYGRDGINAAFPYTASDGPFNLKSFEAPPKDFVQFNPAFYNHWDNESHGWALPNGAFFHHIKADGDARRRSICECGTCPSTLSRPAPQNRRYLRIQTTCHPTS